jgi:transcriptional regulator with XRE-family HTH domain
MKIGEKIKQRRTELKWSQRELAAKMGYNHSTITRIETGKIDIPQSRIAQFSEVLGVSVAYLMDWEEVKKNNDVKTDIVVRMRTDSDFYSVIEGINQLNPVQLASVKQVVDAFLKA